MKAVLSDAWLRAVKPPAAGRIEVRDAKAPGLVVRVAASGAVSFAARGRRADGRETRVTLGTWPVLGLSEARKASLAALTALHRGEHPAAEKRQRRAAAAAVKTAPTVAARLAEWQDAHEKRWSDRYRREVARLAVRELVPVLGNRPLAEVTRAEWTATIAAVARRSASLGASLYRVCASFLSFADASGWIAVHPLPRRGSRRVAPSVPSRSRVLSDAELIAVWRATEELSARPKALLHLLVLTGCRVAEAGGIAVGEIDQSAAAWTLPASRSKNNRSHVMPLPPALVAELGALIPPGAGDRYRLLGRIPGGAFSGFSKLKRRLDELSGCDAWRLHDLRRSVRTGLSALGIPREIAEAAINHAGGRSGLVGVYDKYDFAGEIIAALGRWQAHVAALVAPEPMRSEVVPLRRRA